MRETSKAIGLRERCGDFVHYLHGNGLDIGAGEDPLRIPDGRVRAWDRGEGNALFMHGLMDGMFDFVYSSHCLEHLPHIEYALVNWIRLIKPGGILYLVVPDFELYEKRSWPSRFAPDHLASFSLTVSRHEAGGRTSHYHVGEDLEPMLRRYGIEIVAQRLEQEGYDKSHDDEVDQTLGNALAQIAVIGRKVPSRHESLFLRNELGGGDHANLLPLCRYLYNMGYQVAAYPGNPLYRHLPIRAPGAPGEEEVGIDFVPERNVPVTHVLESLSSRLALDFSGVFFPGLCFSQQEAAEIRRRRAKRYVNVYPYTSIRQKIIAPDVVYRIVRGLERRGYRVHTTRLTQRSEYPWDRVFKHFHPYRGSYFSRGWFLDLAGAVLNICCDGGPLNVSLAAGVPTVGLMTIADHSLMRLYPEWARRTVQSRSPCSPCFRAADYGSREVIGCTRVEPVCGQHFDDEEILQAADDLLALEHLVSA